MGYDIHIDVFEGPLDLLLRLIKKNDLEINEIKIADITAEYLGYLDSVYDLDIDIAGEFLVMTSALMQIKVKHLLPCGDENDIEEDIPFDELKNKLVEYQKYKRIGEFFLRKITENSNVYYRPAYITNKQDFVLDATIFDLMRNLRRALTSLPKDMKEVMHQEIPIETKIKEILDALEGKHCISFTKILEEQSTKMSLIVCFLAVLELVKSRQIVTKQSELFSEIRIYKIFVENNFDSGKKQIRQDYVN